MERWASSQIIKSKWPQVKTCCSSLNSSAAVKKERNSTTSTSVIIYENRLRRWIERVVCIKAFLFASDKTDSHHQS